MKVSADNVNYNSHKTSFKSISKIGPKVLNNKTTSLSDIIHNQADCWKLYKPEILEKFIKSDKELSEILSEMLERLRTYGVKPSLRMFQDFKHSQSEIKKFYELVKAKYGIDLEIPPKVYRFASEQEIRTLKKDGIVRPQRGYWDKFDVTLNPELNWNTYRITFKPSEDFSVLSKSSKIKENVGSHHDYYYLYEGPYKTTDVEKIEQVIK